MKEKHKNLQLESIEQSNIEEPFLDFSQPQNEKERQGILTFLEQKGFLAYENGVPIIDIENLREHLSLRSDRQPINLPGIGVIRSKDFFRTMMGFKAVSKQARERLPQGHSLKLQDAQSVMELPHNLEDLRSLQPGYYANRAQQSLLKPWEMKSLAVNWGQPVRLSSGEATNMSELCLVSVLEQLQAHRDNQGRLIVSHPRDGKPAVFSARLLKEFLGLNPQVTKGSDKASWHSSPLEFAQKYLPHLMHGEKALFNKNDFRRLGASETAETYNTHKRVLNPKAPFVFFTNKFGQAAKYYIGRDRLVGFRTEDPEGIIDYENMYAQQLDPDTVGIIKKEGSVKKMIATLSLLDKEAAAALHNQIAVKLRQKGENPTATKITTNSTLSSKEVQKLIKKYSITDFLPPRPGENPKEYYQRIRPLDNVDFVTDKVQKFFSEAGIGIHNLPWSEQLILSRALLEKNDEKRLSNFTKKYSLTGVRAFLSLDYDQTLGRTILEIGEKLDPALASGIFKKYSEIIDAAAEAQEYLQKNFSSSDESKGLDVQLRDHLLRRGKDLLAQFGQQLREQKKVDSKTLEQQLQAVKANTLLFVNAFKLYKQEHGAINFRDLANAELVTLPATELAKNTEVVKSFEGMIEQNYKNYPKKFREAVKEGFINSLQNPNTNFYLFLHEGKVASGARFDDRFSRDGKLESLYFGSFNTDRSYAGGKVGETMIEQAIDQELQKGVPIEADCDPKAPIAQKYLELGFVAQQIKDYAGVPSFHIELRPESSKVFASKKMNKKELVSLAKLGELKSQGLLIKEYPNQGNIDFFELSQGYVLSRYFTEGDRTYCVYEKQPQKLAQAA